MDRIRVWDLPTRVFHWGLVASVAAAAWTGDDPRRGTIHAVAGHLAAALVVFRLGWGLWGEPRARF
ncbi:MAG: cytochrome b/b6 domain-containing protein, partial [Myxococcota bacterium]